jgi:hypothetical protein
MGIRLSLDQPLPVIGATPFRPGIESIVGSACGRHPLLLRLRRRCLPVQLSSRAAGNEVERLASMSNCRQLNQLFYLVKRVRCEIHWNVRLDLVKALG